jgi:hypothetical protein
MMRDAGIGFAALTAVLVLAACRPDSVRPSIDSLVTLRVEGSDAGHGGATLRLTNPSRRDIYYLTQTLRCAKTVDDRTGVLPDFPTSMAHEALLRAGQSTVIDDFGGEGPLCGEPGAHAGIYACWSEGTWSCGDYTMIWTDVPVTRP